MLKRIGTVFALAVLAVCAFAAQQATPSQTTTQDQNRQGQSGQTNTQDQNRQGQSDQTTSQGQSRQGQGGTTNQAGGRSATAVASADRRFMTDAAEAGLAEVSMGRLALERAANADVKQFAQRMVDDHTNANNELMQIAQAKGVTLPTQPDAKHRSMMTKMEKLSGEAFDREYMRAQLKEHDKVSKMFERQSQRGNDADAKAFAAKQLPVLHEHHQMAENAGAKVGVTMAKSGRSKGDKGATASGTPKQ
jgi:putative membrane protein